MEEDFVEIEIRIKSRDKTKIITIPQAKEADFDVEWENEPAETFHGMTFLPWSSKIKAMTLRFVPITDGHLYGTIKVVDNKP